VTAGPRGALSRFIAADGFFISAGLAFFFLVCLIPILLLRTCASIATSHAASWR